MSTLRDIKDMTKIEIEQWSSHRLLFGRLFNALKQVDIKIHRALEIGAGLFSTEYLSKQCRHLISMDRQKPWYEEMSDRLKHIDNIKMLDVSESVNKSADVSDRLLRKTDLVFIDGCDPRRRHVQMAINHKIPFIVCHDYEGEHGWNELTNDIDYTLYVCRDHPAQTALWTTNIRVADIVRGLRSPRGDLNEF